MNPISEIEIFEFSMLVTRFEISQYIYNYNETRCLEIYDEEQFKNLYCISFIEREVILYDLKYYCNQEKVK